MNDVFKPYRDRVNEQLHRHLELAGTPGLLQQAMAYGVFNGGKRIRPLLVYLTVEALDGSLRNADSTAAAMELIHSYSLIHDDLPAMDDDVLRRGNPTVHIKFDEATAVLAGDALLTLAFEIISMDEGLSPEDRLQLIQLISHAAGASGMVAGQIIDLGAEQIPISEAELINMHRHKTGALISASVSAGAIIAEADSALRGDLRKFGDALGLAFQVKDDILDETGDTEVMGKQQGADRARHKTTFTTTHGLTAAIAYLDELHKEAAKALVSLGEKAQPLLSLADFVVNRDH